MLTYYFCRVWRSIVVLVVVFHAVSASAGVMLNGTRIVLNAKDRNASTVVVNLTKSFYAVQTWVNDEKDDNVGRAPFMALPAIFKVGPGDEQVVRVIKIPGKLPSDRESVFYLNAQEIPVATDNDKNTLKVAIRTRIKLFYRPEGLVGDAIDAPGLLSWELVSNGAKKVLRVKNPTPYNVTFIGVRVMSDTAPIEIKNIDMVGPKSIVEFSLGDISSTIVGVEYSFINDYGGYSDIVKANLTYQQ